MEQSNIIFIPNGSGYLSTFFRRIPSPNDPCKNWQNMYALRTVHAPNMSPKCSYKRHVLAVEPVLQRPPLDAQNEDYHKSCSDHVSWISLLVLVGVS